MFTNLIKIILPILFLSISSQAISSDIENSDINRITSIHFKVDRSAISFHMNNASDRLIVERHIVKFYPEANISMKVHNGILYLDSINQGGDECEVNYKIALSKAVAIQILGGYADIHSTVPFKSFTLSTENITATLDDPQCSVWIKANQGAVDMNYNRALATSVSICVDIVAGLMNLKLPDKATVGFQFKPAYSEFLNTKIKPDFYVSFLTAAGGINVAKLIKPMHD